MVSNTTLSPLIPGSQEWQEHINETNPDWVWLERKTPPQKGVTHAYNLVFQLPSNFFVGYEILFLETGIVTFETDNAVPSSHFPKYMIRNIRLRVAQKYRQYWGDAT